MVKFFGTLTAITGSATITILICAMFGEIITTDRIFGISFFATLINFIIYLRLINARRQHEKIKKLFLN